jgi:hypothetical protein
MGDACSNPSNEDEIYDMIMKNFNRHYQSNRAYELMFNIFINCLSFLLIRIWMHININKFRKPDIICSKKSSNLIQH